MSENHNDSDLIDQVLDQLDGHSRECALDTLAFAAASIIQDMGTGPVTAQANVAQFNASVLRALALLVEGEPSEETAEEEGATVQ